MTKLFDNVPLLGPSDMGFVNGERDRMAFRRDDIAWQYSEQRAPESRAIIVCRDTPVFGWNGSTLVPDFSVAQAKAIYPPQELIFLGQEKGSSSFGYQIASEHFDALKARDDLKLIDMRSVATQGVFGQSVVNTIGTAKAMLLWHERHQFCSACGHKSAVASAGWKRSCSACGAEHFPRTDPVVIMMAVRGAYCLMGRAPQFPEGRYSCLAGFMEPGETIEEAVRREVYEETNIKVGRVRYIQSQPWPFPSSIMVGCFAEAISQDIKVDVSELADARWFSKSQVADVLNNTHAEGINAPPRMAIANHLMELFVRS